MLTAFCVCRLKPGTKRARTDSSDDKRASSNSGDERSSNSSKNGKSSNQRKSTSNGSTTDNSAKRSTRNRSEKSKEKKDGEFLSGYPEAVWRCHLANVDARLGEFRRVFQHRSTCQQKQISTSTDRQGNTDSSKRGSPTHTCACQGKAARHSRHGKATRSAERSTTPSNQTPF